MTAPRYLPIALVVASARSALASMSSASLGASAALAAASGADSSSAAPGGVPAPPGARRPLRAVFSDLDGTLVHFSSWFEAHGVRLVEGAQGSGNEGEDPLRATVENDEGERRACRVLPRSTMGLGYVSDRTVELVADLRERGVKFVIITAARKSTLLERLPLLPTADVAVCECGTRIYYGGELDVEWAKRFEHVSGPLETDVPPLERPEPLWRLYRAMVEAGLTCDSRSYWGCFRVDTKDDPAAAQKVEQFRSQMSTEISSSMNLGKYDFYPAMCGKGNAVRYLQQKLGVAREESAALFDDDNDLPMAEACAWQLLPALTSDSIVAAVRAHPEWRVAKRCGQGVFAIEELLETLSGQAASETPAPAGGIRAT